MNWRANAAAINLWRLGILDESEYLVIEELAAQGMDYDSPASVRLREILAEHGYDGIAYENGFEGEGLSYIALYPEQIITTEGNRRGGVVRQATGKASREQRIQLRVLDQLSRMSNICLLYPSRCT